MLRPGEEYALKFEEEEWVVIDPWLVDKIAEDYAIDPLEIQFVGPDIFYWKIERDNEKNLFYNHGFKITTLTKKQLQKASKPFISKLQHFF